VKKKYFSPKPESEIYWKEVRSAMPILHHNNCTKRQAANFDKNYTPSFVGKDWQGDQSLRYVDAHIEEMSIRERRSAAFPTSRKTVRNTACFGLLIAG
jgi:hypothetical protein